jgi:predicted hotdog family 3-hydroxylacyl-ACP dehydratase
MTPCPWAIEDLLPHARPMLLLDKALVCDADGARATVAIRAGSPFAGPEGIPAHVGIEFMAQACGAWAGGEAKRNGGPVRVGYLLGTRRFSCSRPFFATGERLEVSARLVFRDAEMGVFECRIEDAAGNVLAEAQLSVYQPADEGKEP